MTLNFHWMPRPGGRGRVLYLSDHWLEIGRLLDVRDTPAWPGNFFLSTSHGDFALESREWDAAVDEAEEIVRNHLTEFDRKIDFTDGLPVTRRWTRLPKVAYDMYLSEVLVLPHALLHPDDYEIRYSGPDTQIRARKP